MHDLFAPDLLPGITLASDLVDREEENRLIAAIDAAPLTPFRFGPWTGNRLTHSYGWRYDFEANRPVAAEPIPDWLQPLRVRIARFGGLEADALIQALLIRYDPGAGIGWHRDRPVYGHVLGLSLGTPATMRLRRRREGGFDRHALPLEPRAAYHLAGVARDDWDHSIASIDERRWSITFRSARQISEKR